MTSSRKKPSVAFWATVVVVVALVAYPLSSGPATWIIRILPKSVATSFAAAYYTFYWPLFLLTDAIEPLNRLLSWWAGVFE